MLLMVVCLITASIMGTPFSVTAQANTPLAATLRVMTFNIWLGGELVDFGKVVEAIQAANADVVGLQESEGNVRRLAQALGWQHVNERMQIISRFPLIDPPGGDGTYLFVQIAPGQVVAMGNVHLPSSPYGPELLRDGSPLADVMENERVTRLAALQPSLTALPMLVAQGVPVFLTGDFNTPSHLDWTEAMTKVRDQVKMAVEWPVTKALETAGLTDAYRAVHVDPTRRIGITWTPGYPVPRLKPDEVVDRIDLIFVGGNVEVLSAEIVGEAGGQDVDIPIAPFPSDHRGVVATVKVTPATPPVFVAVKDRAVRVGDAIVVRYHAPGGEEADRIGIVPAGASVDSLIMSLPPMEASFHGAVTFGSTTLVPGEYAVVLIDAEGKERSRSQFWVVAQGAVPMITPTAPVFAAGEPITVRWENAPGYRWDWVGIYAAGDPDLYNYLGFAYTRAAIAGTLSLGAAELGEALLPAGQYEARLMRDDGYFWLASARFEVK
jgi:endonuclease/exonuclease/phosphatase family metal-dependent hydrolase